MEAVPGCGARDTVWASGNIQPINSCYIASFVTKYDISYLHHLRDICLALLEAGAIASAIVCSQYSSVH